MESNPLGLALDSHKGKDLKRQYNFFSKIFHPDKVDQQYQQVSQEVFNTILQNYTLMNNPIPRFLYSRYGNKGLQIYKRYNHLFADMEEEARNRNYDLADVQAKFQNEIEQICKQAYFDTYAQAQYWFEISATTELKIKEEGVKPSFGVKMAIPLYRQSLFFIPSLAIRAKFDKPANIAPQFKVGYMSKLLGKPCKTFLAFNPLDWQNLMVSSNFEWMNLEFNIETAAPSFAATAVSVRKALNANSSLNTTVGYTHGEFNGNITQNNQYQLTENIRFKFNIILFPRVMKIEWGLRYKVDSSCRLYAETALVQSFMNKHSEYYKLDRVSVGIRKTLGNIKCDIGTTFKYFKIEQFYVSIRYFRMSVHIPIFVDEDWWTVAGLGTAFLGMAVLLWSQKNHSDEKKE
jgi:hypothetical protein